MSKPTEADVITLKGIERYLKKCLRAVFEYKHQLLPKSIKVYSDSGQVV